MKYNYHDNTGTYTNPASTRSNTFHYDFFNAQRKLEEIEALEEMGAGYGLKDIAAKINFERICKESLLALERNKKIKLTVIQSYVHEETPTESAKITLQVYDNFYCTLHRLDPFNRPNHFYVDIYRDYLTVESTYFDDDKVAHLPFETRRVLRIARVFYDAWKKWQYDIAYEIVAGRGNARGLEGLREDIVHKARVQETTDKLFNDYDQKLREDLFKQYAQKLTEDVLPEVKPYETELDKINKNLSDTVEQLYKQSPSLKDLYSRYCLGDNDAILKTCLEGNDNE